MSVVDVGIVVPTLGTRQEYLKETLLSIRAAGSAHICIVCPANINLSEYEIEGLFDSRVDDPRSGLPQAINIGIHQLPSDIKYVNWLGDDDLLEPRKLDLVSSILRENDVTFAWGRCRYIDKSGRRIWENKSGRWASILIRVGPNLIPQPGALFSRKAFDEIGGLDPQFGWAFDQDLFTKFIRQYKVAFVPQIVSSFRWHEGSLSAGSRDGSVHESSEIRLLNAPKLLRPIMRVWEVPMKKVIRMAGTRMNNATPKDQ